MTKTRILFISRAYPPVTGGLENQNYELSVWLPKIAEVKTIANTRGKKFLPFFLPFALIKTLFLIKKYDAVVLGDAVLSVIAWKLKFFTKKPIVCVVHGTDLSYPMKLYQKLWIGFFAKKIDKFIAVGNETIETGVRHGLSREKFVFVPNGVDTEKFYETHSRQELESAVGEKLEDKKIILSTGRLDVHKGLDWFSENVVPRLSDDILYIIAGEGKKRNDIERIIKEKGLKNKIKLLGRVSDKDLRILYNTADIYVKPNIKAKGIMEGFGLVAIEAASCQLPVIASDLEGLKDAIKDGENGFLVEPYDADSFVKKINELLANDDYRREFGKKARNYVIENYSWEKISMRYLEEIEKVIHA